MTNVEHQRLTSTVFLVIFYNFSPSTQPAGFQITGDSVYTVMYPSQGYYLFQCHITTDQGLTDSSNFGVTIDQGNSSLLEETIIICSFFIAPFQEKCPKR